MDKEIRTINMNADNSQAETQTPKYKVGDVVWALLPTEYKNREGMLIEHAKITAVVFARSGGATTFMGYVLSANTEFGSIKEAGIFATREEAEAFSDELQAQIKAKSENE